MTTAAWAILAVTLAGGIGIVIGRLSAADSTTPQPAAEALVMRDELREAVDLDQLVLHYQPKVKLSSGRVTCLEALVRWQQPERGLLLPSEFLLVAERCELIEPLTTWVLRRALADYAAWTAAGHDWMVAVNVSARNLTSPDFAVSVGRILHEAGVPANRLRLEVSEAALTFDAELAKQAIGALADQGISISMDHFGMGLTDLAQMCTTYVSEIKIDRTFLGGLPGNERDRAIVRSVIDLGHGLGCLVTAQGVDSQDVADALKDAGCDDAQGHLWLRPGPWIEVARMFGATGTPTDTTTMTAMPSQTTRGSEKASR